jgi:protein-disulfide isomerase
MPMRRIVPITVALILLASCGGATPHPSSAAGARGPWSEHADIPRVAVPVDGTPARGADDPLVTLVVFSDFQCPYCRRSAPTLARLLEEYSDTVRLHFRNLPLPFHEHAELAAEAAQEARAQGGDRAFWAYHDLLIEGELGPDDLVAYAEQIGLDATRFRIALRGRVHEAAIEEDLRLAGELGVGGTPTLFVNGRPLLGIPPDDELRAILDEELAFAREALSRGIPRAEIYERVLAESAHEIPPEPGATGEEEEPPPELDESVLYAVPVDDAPRLGPADAPVTIVAFSDFQCPYCARAVPTLQALMERYPDRIRIFFRHHPLPFHPNAPRAALTAEAARDQLGDEGFWAMHDRLFAQQEALEPDDLLALAEESGLDMDRFRASVTDETVIARVERDEQLARRFGVLGTPTFFVNGRVIQGAQPLPVFVAAVDDALTRAQSEIARGTAPADVYDAVVRGGSDHAVWRSHGADQPEGGDLR